MNPFPKPIKPIVHNDPFAGFEYDERGRCYDAGEVDGWLTELRKHLQEVKDEEIFHHPEWHDGRAVLARELLEALP